MGYYPEEPPPHGHRNPSELAEDELLSSFHGNFCGMPATADEIGPSGIECSGRVEAHDSIPVFGGHMLRIRDVMTRDVFTVTPDTTLREAMTLLSDRHISGAPVVDGGKVVGVFSATDVLAYLGELGDAPAPLTFKRRRPRATPLEDATVGDVMTRHVESLTPDCTVEEAAVLMGRKQIHRVLVMMGEILLGIVSTSDVAKAVAEHKVTTRTFVFG